MLLNYLEHPLVQSRFSINTCRVDAAWTRLRPQLWPWPCIWTWVSYLTSLDLRVFIKKWSCIWRKTSWGLTEGLFAKCKPGVCHGVSGEKADSPVLWPSPDSLHFSSVQSLSHVWVFVSPWTAAHQASLSITNSWSLLKLMSIESVMPSNHLILCRSLLLPPSIFPSIRVFFQWVSSLHQVAKVLELQLQSFQWIFRTDFLQDRLVRSPFSPTNSQESSPTPQFKSIHFSTVSFLYDPTLPSIHDYWKNRSFD